MTNAERGTARVGRPAAIRAPAGAVMSAIAVTIEPVCAELAAEDDLRDLIAFALAAENAADAGAISVVLVDDATIHDLNRRFLDHDEPTDAITFALDGAVTDEDGFVTPDGSALGEIYISCERAAAQSGEWGSDPAREVRFLAVHGVLHLLGWDDATPEDRARMLARQEEILAAWLATRGG